VTEGRVCAERVQRFRDGLHIRIPDLKEQEIVQWTRLPMLAINGSCMWSSRQVFAATRKLRNESDNEVGLCPGLVLVRCRKGPPRSAVSCQLLTTIDIQLGFKIEIEY
jgi:hypothetical protein